MNKMKGKQVAELLQTELSQKLKQWVSQENPQPQLVVILIGDDPASQIYVKRKILACTRVGITSKSINLPNKVPKEELKVIIENLNKDNKVNGILVQLPLPAHLDSREVLSWINPIKDPDCLTATNIGLLFSNQARVHPCTPYGVILLLKHYKVQIKRKKAVVVGRSQIVGKPMAWLLLDEGATVTVCHSQTEDLSSHTRQADIVVVACGKHHLLKASDFKKGATVIDVGIHRIDKGGDLVLQGDINPEGLDSLLEFFSPVPGGVGPMTITGLLLNTFDLAKAQSKL